MCEMTSAVYCEADCLLPVKGSGPCFVYRSENPAMETCRSVPDVLELQMDFWSVPRNVHQNLFLLLC